MMWTTFKSKGLDPFKEWPIPSAKEYKERNKGISLPFYKPRDW
jgi:hypothetical protein